MMTISSVNSSRLSTPKSYVDPTEKLEKYVSWLEDKTKRHQEALGHKDTLMTQILGVSSASSQGGLGSDKAGDSDDTPTGDSQSPGLQEDPIAKTRQMYSGIYNDKRYLEYKERMLNRHGYCISMRSQCH